MIPFTKIQFNLPNILSGARFVLTPPLLFLLAVFYQGNAAKEITLQGFLILLIFSIIVSSDIFDGIAARKLNIQSETGRQFDILADFFYRFLLILYFCIEGDIHYSFLFIFTLIFLLFISGFIPFRIFKSKGILYYSGKSVPVAVTILIGALLLKRILPEVYILFVVTYYLKYAVYLISFIALMIKLVFYDDKSWRITDID